MSRSVLSLAFALTLASSAAAQSNLWSVPLTWRGDVLVAGAPVRITRDSTGGGPSQPSFTPDGRAVLYTATRDSGASARSDIYKRDLTTGIETRVTRTPENENSPTMNARGEIVAVRWQPATLFKEMGVWFYKGDGTPLRELLPVPDTVGYYTELRDGRFVLVQPRNAIWTLALFDPKTKRTTIIDSAISAVVREVPGERAISYVKTTADSLRTPLEIRKYDLGTGRVTTLAPIHRGAANHVWASRNTLIMAQGNGLVARRVGRDTAWIRVATFTEPELRQATAAAATMKGDRIILTSPRRASLAVVVNDSLDAGRSGAAVADMVRALRASGRIADFNAGEGVVVGLVNTAVTRRSPPDALALGQLAIEMFPASHRAFAALGDAQRASGDTAAARASWRKALELNPRASNADRGAATAVERKLAGGPPSTSVPPESLAARVDALFGAYAASGSPGCALGVYRDGRILYTRGYGLANIADATPITPKTIFDLGSTSKQFTATSIILLSQQGKLSLDDDVRRFIPELPVYQRPITIRHLLNHTSGIRDYIGLLTLGGVDISGRATAKQTLDAIARQKALNFEPGSEHLYSNSGYFLLSQIVERVSGKSMRAFAEENIFRPLGMTSTHVRDDHTNPLPGGAISYNPTAAGYVINHSMWEQTGDGAVYTTVEDLLRWDNNFYDPKVGGPKLLEELHRVGRLNDGTPLTYASGLTVSEYRGVKSVSHGGAWMGFRAELQRFPDQHLSVATLCNVANSNPTQLARSVAAVYLDGQLAPLVFTPFAGTPAPPANRPVVTLTDAELQAWTGTYLSTANGSPRVLAVEAGKLVATVGANKIELAPHGPADFSITLNGNSIQLRFERGPDGRRIRQWIGGQEGPAFDEATARSPLLPSYAGTFRSDELAASFTVTIIGETIQVKIPSGGAMIMRQSRDGVFTNGGTTLRFDPPRDGKVGGFVLDLGRVRGLRFVRTD